MKVLAKVDRCNASRRPQLRIVGTDQPTAYADRALPIGLQGYWGHLRLRLYLLGAARGV